MRIIFLMSLLACLYTTDAFATDFKLLVMNNKKDTNQSITLKLADEMDEQENPKVEIEICSTIDNCTTYGPMTTADMEKVVQSDMTNSYSPAFEIGGTGTLSGALTSTAYGYLDSIYFPLTPRSFVLNWVVKSAVKVTAAFFVGAIAGGYIYSQTPRGQKVLRDKEIRDAIEATIHDMSVNSLKEVSLEPEYFVELKRKMTLMLDSQVQE